MTNSIQQLADELRHVTSTIPREDSSRSEAGSRAAKTRWSDPNYVAYQKGHRKGRTFPKQAETLKSRWAEPEFKQMMIESRKP